MTHRNLNVISQTVLEHAFEKNGHTGYGGVGVTSEYVIKELTVVVTFDEPYLSLYVSPKQPHQSAAASPQIMMMLMMMASPRG